MGFLSKLFGKTQQLGDSSVTLNLRENGFDLNGVSFPFPARASELIKVLGEPRIAENQHMPQANAIYCEKYGFDPKTYCPREYYWDDKGLFVCTHENETAHSMFIYFKKSSYPFPMPKCGFSGTLLINGQPWREAVMRNGVLRSAVPLGNITVLISSYGSQKKADSVRVLNLVLKSTETLEFFDRES